MEKKNAELPLIILIIIVLIIILILGAFIYYFLNTPNFSNSLDNSNISLQNINTTNTEQITNSNSLNEVQDDSINADTNGYSQNINTDSQSATSNKNITTYSNTNTSASMSTPNVANDFSSYIGVWKSDFVLDSGIPAEELIINNITSNTINFDYIKYRNFSIDNVIAQLTDNIANFEFSKDDLSVKGTITLSNNSVVLTINSSTFEYIKPGVYTFKSKVQESVLR